MPEANLIHLGRMAYGEAWNLQRAVGERVRKGELADTLLLVEHPPVYTVGRGAHGSLANLLWGEAERKREGIELYDVDRGGDITYHGPGQLVGYPILNLTRYGRDLHQYLRQLEEALIRALSDFGIQAERLPPHTGVWVGNEKIAAIGVKASHWISQHGFALNVDPNLTHFTGIIPCGIDDKGVTSMRRVLAREINLAEVVPTVEKRLADVFEWDYRPMALESLMTALAT
ncbi:lipoyl(octanoyl) transferase LipB [Sulfobacillus harzensis]|uniref:Octanoyltransferase n=1 Tax=Sulfobacillus harzensis TaxID=2729629 RepID=A0A7Y0L0E5_9FIRM|nr:lipoyl(octanoyl) transferase LipB [Sulfobacillus harzensis]NMP20967.1 lipoyl(octanoyl) transferase LipB [Sulfobacillus harzensis]